MSTPKVAPQPVTPPTPKTPSAPTGKKRALLVLGVAIAVLFIGWAIVGVTKHKGSEEVVQLPEETDVATNQAPAQEGGVAAVTTVPTPTPATAPVSETTSDNLVIPSPQDAGLQVAVTNVSVQVPTWVVVYENHNGTPGNVLGAGLFVEGRTSGAIDLLRGTLPGSSYFVGEARDDGDHMYSMQNDLIVRDNSNNPVFIQFNTR